MHEFLMDNGLNKFINIAVMLNLSTLLAYLLSALVLSIIVLITNYERIKLMTPFQQFLFYGLQPYLFMTVLLKRKK